MKIPLNWLGEIITLPKDIKSLTHDLTMVGHMLDKIEAGEGETVIDLELRGNRADCYSILGIAREVSAIYGDKIKPLETVSLSTVKKFSDVSLEVKTPLVKRVGMVKVKNVKIEKSPKWLVGKLTAYGMESVNNIVDLTNYVMIETGEPMHAFDLDKIGKKLEIRLARVGEKITTFTGTEITLTDEDLVWAKPGTVLSVAGAVGEKYNSITGSTKNILVEAANYDRSNIRRTVYRHKLLTDAGIRHEKELDPNMVEGAIARFLYFIKKYNWGTFIPEIYDYYPKKVAPWKVELNYDYLKTLGGVDITTNEIKKILSKLNFEITSKNKTGLTILVPTYRTDVTLEEDLIEEIIRIYGYDNVPVRTLSLEIPKNVTPNYIVQEEKLRNAASSVGFDEMISSSFVKENYLDKNIPVEVVSAKIVSIENPPSPDNRYLRTTLLPNLLEMAQKIKNERGESAQLFELGKIYFKEGKNYTEKRKLGLIYWKRDKKEFADFKKRVVGFFAKAGLPMLEYSAEIFNLPLSDSYLLKVDNKSIGFGGMISDTFYTEIDLDAVLGLEAKYKASLWPKFPPQIEDITFVIPEKTYVGEVAEAIKSLSPRITKVELTDTFKDSYTFNIEYQDVNKTLTDIEVEQIRNKLLQKVKEKFGGQIKD